MIVRDTPLVEGALAHFVARVVRSYWGGDHSLFLGHVEYARYGEGEPLLFHGGRYERMVRARALLAAAARPARPAARARRRARVADGDVMRSGEPAPSCCSCSRAARSVERPGRR